MRSTRPRFRTLIARFRRDRSALAATEFAIILPVMVLLYLGGFEVSEAVTINQKVTHATSVLGDLVAQTDTVTNAEMNNILDATTTVLTPYPVASASMVVTGVRVDSDGVATVAWSEARNMSALVRGSPIAIPADLATPNTFLIMAEVHYTYLPTFGKVLTGELDLTDQFFLRPRVSAEVRRL